MSQDPAEFKLYPIQATHIGPRELYIKAHRPPSVSMETSGLDYEIGLGHGNYNEAEKTIQVGVRLEVGKEEYASVGSDVVDSPKGEEDGESTPPFYLRIEMVAAFSVDEDHFPADRIYEWAKQNAVFIMYPYLREHVFALTARAGFRPMLLPLVEVPTLKVVKAEQAPAESPTT